MASKIQSVQVFGRKKNAVAVAYAKPGRGLIKVNGKPIELLEPKSLREKAYEPVLILGAERFSGIDMRVRVKGGGSVAQLYAIRQSIAKALVSYYQKCKLWCWFVVCWFVGSLPLLGDGCCRWVALACRWSRMRCC